MSTARTRSTLPAWGALLISCAVVVAGCTSAPVATGTLPPTTSRTPTSNDTPQSSTAPSTRPSPTTSPSQLPLSPAPSKSGSESAPVQPEDVDPGPIVVTVSTDAPSSPAVPQASTLDIPAGASQRTIGGAGDFVKWWFNLGTAALQAKDNSMLEAYSLSNCEECNDLIRRNAESVSVGRSTRLEGDAWIDLIQADMTSENVASFVLIGYVPSISYLSADGSVTETIEPSAFMVGVDAEWDSDHWKLARFRKVEAP